MAVTVGTISAQLANTLLTDNAVSDANSVAASASATTLYTVRVDGSSATSASFVKMIDDSSAAPDTNNPDYVFYTPTGTVTEYVAYEGNAFATALRYWGTSTRANATAQAAAGGTLALRLLFT
tara:strand:- start:258 stop:626 length:369 start_codon:yes stop_codon:yes gene_type:complete